MIFYAGLVSDSGDPLFIVPAVQPDEDVPNSSAGAPSKKPLITVGRRRLQRTTRIVRHIDPWSVFRVTLVFHVVLYLTLLLTGVLLWNVANATGTVDNVERFMESFGWESFEFDGGEIFRQAWVLGLFLVVGLTGLAVLMATTFNLITDLVGGIRVTFLEEGAGPDDQEPSRGWLARLRVGRTD
ncbi:MAG: hypothetical protein B7C54_06410 [Acidimicrobiales bacterium mtb01]|nr:hypothetical protein [Actinomycetota bacterium]TEX46817.1 MAG: hypothetical protein B7C54_06410 [Acidimicrobiales bacterium mtb01]